MFDDTVVCHVPLENTMRLMRYITFCKQIIEQQTEMVRSKNRYE